MGELLRQYNRLASQLKCIRNEAEHVSQVAQTTWVDMQPLAQQYAFSEHFGEAPDEEDHLKLVQEIKCLGEATVSLAEAVGAALDISSNIIHCKFVGKQLELPFEAPEESSPLKLPHSFGE